jgi:hypothetical protein
MSIPLYLMASMVMGGLWLNRNGKQSRAYDNQRQSIPEDEKPSSKNMYHSEKTYDVWSKEFDESSRSHLKAQDPINENVLPRFYNEMQTNQQMSPEMQSYIEKRGSRFKEEKAASGVENFINEGGKEQSIDTSPMFNPLGKVGTSKSFLTKDENNAVVAQFSIGSRKTNGNNISKQEHFGNMSIAGPLNSNNPNTHSNMVPYFGSHIYQNTDSMANQTLMERFTGQTNSPTELRSQPKREIPSLFDRTPGQTYIYGSPSENVDMRDRYQSSTLKTNLLPTDQVRVGPGVTGTYGDKPTDGFHPYYRPAERTVDDLRVNKKNQYGGRLNPGEEMVKNRGVIGDTFKRRPDTFYNNDPRRWFKTTGAFTAAQIRENFNMAKQNREDSNVSYIGNAGQSEILAQRPVSYLEGSAASMESENNPMSSYPSLNSQVQHTNRHQLPSTGPYRNLHGDAAKIQSYQYDEAKPTTRQTTHVEGYMGQVGNESTQRTQTYQYDQAKPTTRQTTHVEGYMGQVGNEGIQRNQKYQYDNAKPTTRQTTHVEGYMGQVGNEGIQRNQKYQYDQAKPTTRQTTHVEGYMGQVGNEGIQRNQKYQYDQAKPTTRQTTHVEGYMGQVGNEGIQRNQKYQYDQAKPTTRQTTHVEGYMGQVGNEGIQRNQKYQYDDAKPTIRETTHVTDYNGIVGSEGIQRIQKYQYDDARPTTKESTHVIDYSGIAGNGENTLPKSYESMYNATNKNTQEELLATRSYGANKSTNITVGACDVNMQIRQRANYDVTKWGPNETKLYTAIPNVGDNYFNTTSQNQRDQAGIRQPEGYVVEQHNRNPYSQSLESAPRQTSSWTRGEVPFTNQ